MKFAGVGTIVLAGVVWGAPALADCSDPPGPKVDWRRCTMHAREFVDGDLTGARLKDGRFTRVNFSGSNLSGVDARRAKFIDAIAKGTSFDHARLSGADFTKATLTGASLKGADLYGAQFQKANLRGVDLSGAKIGKANMTGADLSGATWIDGETICAEGSIGQCKRPPKAAGASG